MKVEQKFAEPFDRLAMSIVRVGPVELRVRE
jgi:hypothetical protein